ncbi:hypothetical protein E8E12_008153 [Didymella heteroderae]|uniref:C2H2-type domain-containing protein n=1 Tax=Didymella heteroderae TaxID=1769908 RepID=A0A9P4WR91_9PLEO|nr:hypothetical protein E8E12_008153 [Didymella heteroderae]
MEQPNSASYVSSPYLNTIDLPSSHLPFRPASNGPTTSDSRQHSFDESSLFSNVPQEILNFPVSRVAESSLDPWLMDLPGTASPDSSRLSMSPSQGIATPPSDGFYSPPYPEQLQLPAYQLLEQPQLVRSCSTSHPNWVSSGENWERTYTESDLWSAHSFVAQSWVPHAYDGYVPPNAHPNHASHNALPLFAFSTQIQVPLPESVQPRGATGSPTAEDSNEDAISSDEESDWDDDESDYSQSGSTSTKSKPRTKAPCVRQDRWMIPTGVIHQPETRGYACNVPGCTTAFVRPEHLRRHIRSKHSNIKDYRCIVPGCTTSPFSRGDNLRDHYWTHLHRGGRAGKNRKYSLQELKEMLGPKERKLIKKLRQKLQQHLAKEKLKKQQRPARPAYNL